MANYYSEYQSRVIKLNNMFSKIGQLLNVSYYKNKFIEIQDKVKELENAKIEQDNVDYKDFYYELGELISGLNNNYMPFYEIHLLTNRIENIVDSLNEDNYNEIKNLSIELINCVYQFVSCKEKDKQEILDKAYMALYEVICLEASIDKCEVYSKIKEFNNDKGTCIEEKIGLLMREDLECLPEDELLDIELNHRNSALDFNFFSSDVINKIVSLRYPEEQKAYLERRSSATAELLSNMDKIKTQKDNIEKEKREKLSIVRKLSGKLALAHLKVCSLLMIPIVAFVSTWSLGGKLFKHTTTTRNAITNEQLGNQEDSYALHDNKYVALVKVCSPWRENEKGGYIRDVVEYTYKDKDNTEGINYEEIIKSVQASKKYTEKKDILYENENTTDQEVFITETVEDSDDYKDNIVGSVGIELLVLFGLYILDFMISAVSDDEFEYVEFTSDQIRELLSIAKEYRKEFKGRITRKVIKERLATIGDKFVKLQEEYQTVSNRFGSSYTVNEVAPSEIQNIKKYIKK